MPIVQDAPVRKQLVDQKGFVTPGWRDWFSSLLRGDNGAGNPSFPTAGLSFTGPTPTVVSNYYQNNGFCDFFIQITPGGGGTTSSTAGTTYFELPVDVRRDTACFGVQGTTNAALGVVQASTNRVYPPNWSSTSATVTISGRVVCQ